MTGHRRLVRRIKGPSTREGGEISCLECDAKDILLRKIFNHIFQLFTGNLPVESLEFPREPAANEASRPQNPALVSPARKRSDEPLIHRSSLSATAESRWKRQGYFRQSLRLAIGRIRAKRLQGSQERLYVRPTRSMQRHGEYGAARRYCSADDGQNSSNGGRPRPGTIQVFYRLGSSTRSSNGEIRMRSCWSAAIVAWS